jgi:hypothetical protein
MENEEYKEKIVAFIDILGFTNLINQTTEDDAKHIAFFNKHISHVLEILKDQYDRMFSIKMFSDCICISCDDGPYELDCIVDEICFIQLYFSISGIFVRGGLSRGRHYENENIIYSKGLIKAYHLEKESIYPRIIIDPDLFDSVKDKSDNIMKSPDGKYFLDYLDNATMGGLEYDEFLEQHKNAIVIEVQKNISNPRVIDKFKWLADYHNTKFKSYFTKEAYDEEYIRELESTLMINIENSFPKFEK